MPSDFRRLNSQLDESLARNLILGIVGLIPIGFLAIKGHTNLDAGILLSILVLPVTLQTTLGARIPRRLLLLLVAALACGPVLTYFATTTPARAIDGSYEIELSFLLFSVCVTIPTVYWSVLKSGWVKTLNVFAVGLIIQGVIEPSAWQGNAWKYVFAWPITALLLPKRRSVIGAKLYGLTIAFALIAVSIVFNYRSFSGFLFGAILISIFSSRFRHTPIRTKAVVSVLMVCLVSIALYFGGSFAATHGLLGHSIQATSQKETTAGYGLLIGARPEVGASIALFESRPIGFGPGVIPSITDIDIAKAGLARLGVQTNSQYVNQFLLGGHIELHSILFDMWVDFGLVGLIAALYFGWLSTRVLFRSVSAARSAPIVLLTLGLSAVWDVLFSPLPNLNQDIVAVLVLIGFIVSTSETSKSDLKSSNLSNPTGLTTRLR
jgi:hypothetical protein